MLGFYVVCVNCVCRSREIEAFFKHFFLVSGFVCLSFVYRIIESELDLDLVNGESCLWLDAASALRAQMISSMCCATSSIATKEEKEQKRE